MNGHCRCSNPQAWDFSVYTVSVRSNTAQRGSNSKNLIFFLFFKSSFELPKLFIFLRSNGIYFQWSLTFFYFFSVYFKVLRIHISLYSLTWICIILWDLSNGPSFIPFWVWVKTFIIPKTNPGNSLRYVCPHSGSLLWLQISSLSTFIYKRRKYDFQYKTWYKRVVIT